MVPLQSLVSTAAARIVRPAPLSPEKVLFAWRVAVGPALARVAHVALSTDRILVVDFTDERWRAELERAGPAILERLRELLGAECVERVSLRGPQRVSRAGRGSGTPRKTAR